jgi:hypothetical protein
MAQPLRWRCRSRAWVLGVASAPALLGAREHGAQSLARLRALRSRSRGGCCLMLFVLPTVCSLATIRKWLGTMD